MSMHSIMIVDDSADMLHLYAEVLRHEGFEVFTAATGAECLAQLDCVIPDIFLMDVVLPDWNGIDLVREIKLRPEFASSMVVLLSGLKIDSESKVEGLSAGAVDYLVRPIPNREIVAKTKSLIKIMDLEKSLLQLSRELEQAVAERTRELSHAVDELQAEVVRRIAAEKNVTELNELLEQKVETKTAELRDTLNELETFSYSISHDLQAPLHRIYGFCDILKSDYADTLPEGVSGMVERIIHAQSTMSAYIDGLLNLSRFSRTELAMQEVDLGEITRELFDELSASVSETPVTFSTTALRTVCDPVLIRFAIQNLMANALKFSRNNPEPLIVFEGEVNEAETVCWIRDNGVGFSCKGDELFTAFKRGVAAKEFEGSGIGLAIVKKIILRHGGRVFAESTHENGSRIGFALPRVP